jgi:two-component system chemotaxis sensor kinase CheA
MSAEDDELLELFLEESRESLDGIEGDLLSIEAAGADIDDDLVNKVFRAIHSVKGGAGFFDLDKVRTLSHTMENVLGLIRNHELIPEKQVVGALLEGADELVSMINNVSQIDEMDISETAAKLDALTRADGAAAEPAPSALKVCVAGRALFELQPSELETAKRAEHGGEHVYLLTYDLLADIQRKGRNPIQVINELIELVLVLDARVDLDAVGMLEDYGAGATIPFLALVATQMEGALLAELQELDISRVNLVVFKDGVGQLDAVEPVETDPDQPEPVATFPEPERQFVVSSRAKTAGPQPAAVAPVVTPAAPPPPVAPAIPASLTAAAPAAATPAAPFKRAAPATAATSGGVVTESKSKSRASQGKVSAEPHGSIRVKLDVLDRLMTLAGELVLTRNQLTQSIGVDASKTEDATQRIDLITTELQDAIMATRMQSIGIVFHKFRRVVRDLAAQLGKQVQLILEGEDVELDRTIIEAIGDPLTHLVRNALDHGLERPDQRVAAGKSQKGTLRLSAFHKAGNVIIEIEDDGRGIDPQKVKAKALSKGILAADQLESMSSQALQRLIFRPGFSTAEQVTDMSGRGVGMDVVVSNLTELGGVVDLDSQPGRGTLIHVKLPLTLAIIPALLVKEEGETFAIPQASLVELLRIPARDIKTKIKQVGDSHVMLLRGELLPLVRLRDVLEMPNRTYSLTDESALLENVGFGRSEDRRGIADRRQEDDQGSAVSAERRFESEDRRRQALSALNVAVVAAGEFHFGIVLEALMDSSEIVVKPLGRHLRDCPAYAGATILGDGRSALILDVIGVSKSVRATAETDVRRAQKAADVVAERDRLTLVLVENGKDDVLAVPMGLIERIERIQRANIQQIAGKRTLYYRGRSLLLFTVDDVAGVPPIQDVERPYVLVYRYGKREVGLLVSNLIDITDSSSELDDVTYRQPGIFGSTVLSGQITLLVDIQGIAAKMLPRDQSDLAALAAPTLLQQVPAPQPGAAPAAQLQPTQGQPTPQGMPQPRAAAPAPAQQAAPTILVVDDSKFFLSKIVSFVREAGYQTLTAMDGQQGLELLEANADRIDIVFTDIEMPVLDGFGFVEQIRRNPRFAKLPVVAITSVMGSEAEARGRAAGIDEYLVKLDREMILERAAHLLRNGRDG